MRGNPPRAAIERLLDRIVCTDTFFAGTPCWIFTGCRASHGYGNIGVGSNLDGSKRTAYTHRVAYEALVGAIPDGLSLDHLCRVRSCCNPAHLEPVTQAENVMRGLSPVVRNATATECVHGHTFTPENTYTRPDNGRRACKTCHGIRDRARRARQSQTTGNTAGDNNPAQPNERNTA